MILHIGKNDGSHMNNTVKELRKRGLNVKGITFYYSDMQETDAIFCFKKWQFIFYYLLFFYLAIRADIVHLWSEQVPGIVWFLRLIKKPYLVEWTGSDIRDPKQSNLTGQSEYVAGSVLRHNHNEQKFKDVLNVFSSHILINHIDHDNKVYIPHRLDIDRYHFNPTYHSPLRVAHCTSHREAKGTDKVLRVLGLSSAMAIMGKAYLADIEFDLIENVSREEAIRRVSECDIVIGQMVWGEHGTQELESIAMGKPVLCYISHDKETPVIKCTLEQIPKWLKYFSQYPEEITNLAVLQYNKLKAQQEEAVRGLMNAYEKITN